MNQSDSRIKLARPGLSLFRSFLLIGLLTVFLSSGASAQSFKIIDIIIEGNRAATSDMLQTVINLKPGDELKPNVIPGAVRRLYNLGFFKDIKVDAEEVPGGVRLIFRLEELPRLKSLEFRGNDKIKSDDLEEKLGLTIGRYLTPHLIFEKRNKILALYGEKGYFLAEVDYELDYGNDSASADLIYKIREGSKVKVEKVYLTGSVQTPPDKIIGKMRNRKRGFLKSSNFDKEKYPEDLDKIIAYLHDRGFVDAYLKSDSITIDSVRNRMTIYLDVYEGPRYYFGKTTWSGNQVLPSDLLDKVVKYKEGDIFNRNKFDKSTWEVYFAYQEKGHLHTRVIDEFKTRDSIIDINYDIVEGLPSKINLVNIIGNTKTKDFVIRREMVTRPGQTFHRSYLLRSVREVMALNYFETVMPDFVDLPSGDVNIIMNVKEKQTGSISAGAGYNGRDKFVGTFGMGIPNFRGMGQTLNFNVDAGSSTNSYSISFTEPWLFGRPTSLGADLYISNQDYYDDYTEGRRGAAIQVGRRLRWPDNYTRAYVRYRIEDDRFFDFSTAYRYANSELSRYIYDEPVYDNEGNIIDIIAQGDTTFVAGNPLPGSLLEFGEEWKTSSSLQFTITRDSRNLPEFATSGSKITYSFENVGGFLGGYWKYQKHMLSLAKFIPVFKDIALAGKLTIGAIHAPDGDNRILAFSRFSPGGTDYDGVVRGYDGGSLTPDTMQTINVYEEFYDIDSNLVATGLYQSTSRTRVRGNYMLVGNLELQIPLIKNQLYGLLFTDAGNSFLELSDYKPNRMYRSYGFGFRLVVPGIGTLGFDFGYPLDDRVGQDKGWKPHFQIGTTIR